MDENDKITNIGQLVKLLRKEKEISLYDLEKAVGISPSYISRLEGGSRDNPSIEVIVRLCKYFGVSLTTIEELYPDIFQGNDSSITQSLEELILKNDFAFAGLNKANIDVKLSIQKAFRHIETYVREDSPTRLDEGRILQELDVLKKKIRKESA